MSILWFGGEMGAVVPSESAPIETTGSSYFESAFSRCAINVYGGGSGNPDTPYIETPSWGEEADFWFHARLYDATITPADQTRIEFLDGSGTAVVRLRLADKYTWSMQYLNASSVWTQAGPTISVGGAATHMDFHVVSNSGSGSITLYLAGTSRISGVSLPLGHIGGIDKARPRGSFTSAAWSQMIAATESTIGARVFTVPISGAGSDSAFTGDYTEIDEIAYSDADFINSGTANQVSTFAVNAPNLTGYTVRAVAVAARAKRDASGPQNLQLVLRSAGTNYFSSTKSLDFGYGAHVAVWETNPATSADWVNTAISSLQPGVKSIT